MNYIMFTDKKQCPYCGSSAIEHLDLADLLQKTDKSDGSFGPHKKVFRCSKCKDLFYYTGESEPVHQQKL